MEEINQQQEMNELQEKKQKNGYWVGLLSGLLLAILLIGVGVIVRQTYDIFHAKKIGNLSSREADRNVLDEYTSSKVEVIEETIHQYYLEEADADVLENGIYNGMVNALGDPYSVYYSSEELEEIQMGTEGIYYGIGAYVSKGATDEFCMISGVIANTPAEEAGLREGDILYAIDGTMAAGMDTTEVVALIKGEEGTTVVLTIVREGEEDYLEIPVERRQIESPTVNFEMMENQIAYIQITEFDDVTEHQFKDALTEVRAMGMKGLVLDLRSNPGGNLSTVCEISRMVLPKGMIVYTEDKYGKRDEYTSDGKNRLEVPAVVLVNEYSASASEILAGAMKDHGVATIMGTTTFGKGIVQRIISLSDGSAVKLTVSKYYTPSGNDIHEKGVEPDIEVVFDSEAYYENDYDNQLEEAKKVLEEKIQ